MGTSASKVHIWNRALSRIGETEMIQGEDDERGSADVCRIHWDDLVVEVLEAFPWPFARKQETIEQPTGVTRTGWEYVYTLPADCVTPLAILAEDERLEILPLADRHPFGIMLDDDEDGRLLGCGLDSGDFETFEYIALVTHIPLWSRTFVSAITFRLAVELALAVSKDAGQANAMMSAYNFTINQAFALELNGHQSDAELDAASVLARG